MRILVLDVGGTVTKSAVIGEDNQITQYQESPSKVPGSPSFLHNAIRIAQAYEGYDALSFAISGQTDTNRRALLFHYGGKGGEVMPEIPFGDMVREKIDAPVFMLNDSNAAALGEARFGAGAGVKNFVCVTYGTGVGSGIILGGELYLGKRGIAGEIGHLVVHAGGRPCGCGFRGCYERYASTTALVRSAAKFDPSLKNGIDVCAAMDRNPSVRRAVQAWIREVVEGLCSVSYLLNPDCFILGGGIMQREDILAMVKQRFRRRSIPTFADVDILPAQLGNKAGLYGALAFARESIESEKGGQKA